jgi:hypothetical protein
MGGIREINEEENYARSAGYFECAFLVEIRSRERGMKCSGDEQGCDGDGHHGSGSLCDEAIVQLFGAAESADKEAHTEDLRQVVARREFTRRMLERILPSMDA